MKVDRLGQAQNRFEQDVEYRFQEHMMKRLDSIDAKHSQILVYIDGINDVLDDHVGEFIREYLDN